jgi:hypothetical protein
MAGLLLLNAGHGDVTFPSQARVNSILRVVTLGLAWNAAPKTLHKKEVFFFVLGVWFFVFSLGGFGSFLFVLGCLVFLLLYSSPKDSVKRMGSSSFPDWK